MASWPGWNSIESASAWSSFYFWSGILVLIVVGLCGLVSHRYSLRKDELVASAQEQFNTRTALNARRNEAAMMQLRQDLAAAQKAPTASAAPLGNAQASPAQRHLAEAQKREIIEAIAAFDGQPITVTSLYGDKEAQTFRDEFVEIFKKANWAIDGHVGEMGLDAGQSGVAVAMDKTWVDAGNKLPNAGAALITVLAKLQLMPARHVTLIGNLPPGRIVLVIGTKPPA